MDDVRWSLLPIWSHLLTHFRIQLIGIVRLAELFHLLSYKFKFHKNQSREKKFINKQNLFVF